MNRINRDEAVRFIRQTDGKFFSVRFTKRTTGEPRHMTARLGVKKHLAGGEPAYNFDNKGLIPVYDIHAPGYRSIPIEGITAVMIRGRWHEITP